jgi:uncharacterized protein (DUF1697 family)
MAAKKVAKKAAGKNRATPAPGPTPQGGGVRKGAEAGGSTWVAFLRGVNLGKRQMKMAELKASLERLGLREVKTIVASGNARFVADDDKKLKERIEAGLEKDFSFPVKVILRSADELTKMFDSKPFAKVDPKADVALHVLLFDEPMKSRPKIPPLAGDYEAARIDDDAIFFVVHKKADGTYLGRSALGDALASLEKGQLVTMRNWNTMLKLLG